MIIMILALAWFVLFASIVLVGLPVWIVLGIIDHIMSKIRRLRVG